MVAFPGRLDDEEQACRSRHLRTRHQIRSEKRRLPLRPRSALQLLHATPEYPARRRRIRESRRTQSVQGRSLERAFEVLRAAGKPGQEPGRDEDGARARSKLRADALGRGQPLYKVK